MRTRLDIFLAKKGYAETRSQAASYIKLGKIKVNGRVVVKPGFLIGPEDNLTLTIPEQYVSRAGLKLASVSQLLDLHFKDKVVLDVGSSTGGFTDYALQHGARKVIAVDVGTNQLHPRLRNHPNIELHEKTDVRHITSHKATSQLPIVIAAADIIIIDVSFISLRDIIPHVIQELAAPSTCIIAMVKPQFEAGRQHVHKGVIKNDTIRRQILKSFEAWVKQYAVIKAKADSEVAGSKGNRERFYLLTPCK